MIHDTKQVPDLPDLREDAFFSLPSKDNSHICTSDGDVTVLGFATCLPVGLAVGSAALLLGLPCSHFVPRSAAAQLIFASSFATKGSLMPLKRY